MTLQTVAVALSSESVHQPTKLEWNEPKGQSNHLYMNWNFDRSARKPNKKIQWCHSILYLQFNPQWPACRNFRLSVTISTATGFAWWERKVTQLAPQTEKFSLFSNNRFKRDTCVSYFWHEHRSGAKFYTHHSVFSGCARFCYNLFTFWKRSC